MIGTVRLPQSESGGVWPAPCCWMLWAGLCAEVTLSGAVGSCRRAEAAVGSSPEMVGASLAVGTRRGEGRQQRATACVEG